MPKPTGSPGSRFAAPKSSTASISKRSPEYPDFAWQEAIVNAFAHRDYEHQGREVEAWFYEDRMEVSSPGDLLPPVTLARLREGLPAHATRNPLLVRVLADAGVMREGEGVARIFEEMAESSLREPEVELEDGVFSVRLYNEPVAAGPLDAIPGKRPIRQLSRLARLREHFLRHPSLNNADYRRIFAVSRYAAARELRRLVEGGLPPHGGQGQRRPLSLPQPSLDVPGNRAK